MNTLKLVTAAAALFIAGITTAAALDITEETHANYQDYLNIIGSTKRGAFAVSPDGAYSWFIYCTNANCIPDGIGRDAMAKCQTLAGGQKCSLMAYGREVRIPFTVVPATIKLSPGDAILAAVLDAERLKQVIVGNTLQGEYTNNRPWSEYYDANGEIRGKDEQHGTYKASYKLDGDKVCFDYPGTNDDWCAQVSMRGNRVDFLHDGEHVTFIRNTIFLDGNPYNL